MNSLNIDSLKIELPNLKGLEKIDALIDLSYYSWNSDPKQGISYGMEALELSPEDLDPIIKSKMLSNIGINYWALGEFDNSLKYHKEALDINQKAGNQSAAATNMNNIALVYNQQGNFSMALEYQQQSLNMQMESNNPVGIIRSSNNMGLIYAGLEDYEKALTFFLQAFEAQKKYEINTNLAGSLNNLGVMYNKLGNIDKSEEYYKQALDMYVAEANTQGEATCLYNLAKIDSEHGLIDDALIKARKCLELRLQFDNPYYITEAKIDLARYLIEKEIFSEAEILLNQTLNTSVNNKFTLLEGYSHWHLSDVYTGQNKHKIALTSYKKYITIKDSIYSEEQANKISSLTATNDLKLKERENLVLSADNKLHILEIEKQKSLKLFFAILTILITILIILIYRHDRHKVKAVKELTRSYKLIEEKRNELSAANAKLKDLDASKNKFFSIIAHDLRNPLVAQLSGFRIFYKHLDSMQKNEIQKIAFEMKKNTTHVLELLENLLHWSRLQMGRIEFDPIPINPQTIAFHCFQVLKLKAEQKEITMEQKLENIPAILADKNMITLVLNNLLTNAIKFSEPNKKIIVSGKLEKDCIKISVIDEGIGMKPENLKNVFKLDKSSSTLGTQKEKGTGLGLILCKEFLQKNNGSMEISSSLGKGTTVSFKLPAQVSEVVD